MNNHIGTAASRNSKDVVYKENHNSQHEFFLLLESTQTQLLELSSQSESIIRDELNKCLKDYKRLVAYYFTLILKKLDREPSFRFHARPFNSSVTECIFELNLNSIQGKLSKGAPLPGHITHYYEYIKNWFSLYEPLKNKLKKSQRVQNKDNKIKPNYLAHHITFVESNKNI